MPTSFFIWENVKGTFSSNNGADAAIPFADVGVIESNGNCLLQSGFYPKIERESPCRIYPKRRGSKYFLSDKTTARLMSYRDNKEIPVHHNTVWSRWKRKLLLNVNSMHKKN